MSSSASASRVLASTDEVAERLGDLIVLDASWHMPGSGRDAKEEFLREAIPGSGFFDLDDICDKSSPYPHMVPSGEHFRIATAKLGLVDADADVVVYDSHGMFSAARCCESSEVVFGCVCVLQQQALSHDKFKFCHI